ncbi:hypothetical protein EJ04DRAFT_605081 [Polyplosphaeria fusca]|uniref:TRAM domain-containing protein n=1 Tax=Polyplosphaeria fusca TaxID=682080 RepID=A0A9P4QW10_9PLEO|nr:hypothetical protein EJ04DRAFT_605081 [Polyplosphaeria fusca]
MRKPTDVHVHWTDDDNGGFASQLPGSLTSKAPPFSLTKTYQVTKAAPSQEVVKGAAPGPKTAIGSSRSCMHDSPGSLAYMIDDTAPVALSYTTKAMRATPCQVTVKGETPGSDTTTESPPGSLKYMIVKAPSVALTNTSKAVKATPCPAVVKKETPGPGTATTCPPSWVNDSPGSLKYMIVKSPSVALTNTPKAVKVAHRQPGVKRASDSSVKTRRVTVALTNTSKTAKATPCEPVLQKFSATSVELQRNKQTAQLKLSKLKSRITNTNGDPLIKASLSKDSEDDPAKQEKTALEIVKTALWNLIGGTQSKLNPETVESQPDGNPKPAAGAAPRPRLIPLKKKPNPTALPLTLPSCNHPLPASPTYTAADFTAFRDAMALHFRPIHKRPPRVYLQPLHFPPYDARTRIPPHLHPGMKQYWEWMARHGHLDREGKIKVRVGEEKYVHVESAVRDEYVGYARVEKGEGAERVVRGFEVPGE